MRTFEHLLPYCTVRLNGIQNNQVVSTGTGFFYFFNDTFTDDDGNRLSDGSANLAIVTNKHVIENMEEVVFYFTTTNRGESELQKEMLTLKLDSKTVINHPESDVDLCIILAHEIVGILKEKNKWLHCYPVRKSIRIDEGKLSSMGAIQDLLMIGYPNGLWDNENNLPIMRTGINATPLYTNYLGKECFAVDIATYRGSSGSPVFIYDKAAYIHNGEIKFGQRLIFLGVIAQAHFKQDTHNAGITTEEMLHVGIAIKAHKLDVFEELVGEHYK